MNRSTFANAIIICLLLIASTAKATNGYWAHGYGPKSKSMAGACVALPLEGMCNAINPATSLELGDSMEFNLSIFIPERGFHANNDGFGLIAAGDYESSKELFFIPGFNYNMMLDADSSIGITLGANGGMNTHYDGAVFSRFNNPAGSASGPTGIDLMQGFLGFNYSRRLDQYNTIGIMPFFAAQALKVYGLEPFKAYSSDPSHVTNNGQDLSYGGGLRIGWMGRISEQLTLGASYQTRSWMSKFDKYGGLLAEQGGFDIPSNYEIGFAYRPTEDLTFVVDFQRILYGEVKSVANSTDIPADATFTPVGPLMGSDNGMGFGWNDVNIFKFGVQWHYDDKLTLRAGYSHADQAFDSSQALLNVLAPAVVRDHYTFGLTTLIDEGNELNFALGYVPNVNLHGVNNQIGGQSGYLYMNQWDVNIGWTLHY